MGLGSISCLRSKVDEGTAQKEDDNTPFLEHLLCARHYADHHLFNMH